MTEPTIDRSPVWKSRFESLATALLVVVTVMIGGFALTDRMRPAPARDLGVHPVLTSIPIPLADSPVKGNKASKVALVLFSDFECPFCARTALEVLPQLQAQYIDTGKALLVWRHFPLQIHAAALGAAEAAECASRQGRFWGLHDWAFAHQQALGADHLRDAAERLGLDMPIFDKCVAGEASEKISSDIALAKELGVSGTPTWFVGTIEPNGSVRPVDRIVGLGPVELYGNAIDTVARSRSGS